jgi:PIN domain
VINRPKFRLKQTTIDHINRYCYLFAEFIVPEERIYFIKADPKDNKFLEAAIAGDAEYIVSGDAHLLDSKNFGVSPFRLPGNFWIGWGNRKLPINQNIQRQDATQLEISRYNYLIFVCVRPKCTRNWIR